MLPCDVQSLQTLELPQHGNTLFVRVIGAYHLQVTRRRMVVVYPPRIVSKNRHRVGTAHGIDHGDLCLAVVIHNVVKVVARESSIYVVYGQALNGNRISRSDAPTEHRVQAH